jgi:hypothetical protein
MQLFLIQLAHTVITIYIFACLFYIIYCQIRDKRGSILIVAYVSILIESLFVLTFGMVCPIRILVNRLYSPQTPDILFPTSISRHFIGIGILLIVIAAFTKLRQINIVRKS